MRVMGPDSPSPLQFSGPPLALHGSLRHPLATGPCPWGEVGERDMET